MMITKSKLMLGALFLVVFGSIALIGCGGGGSSSSGSSPTPTPTLKVLPADYDFGIVTPGNTVETLEVTIQNTGNADLLISNIALTDANNFSLDLNGGTTPCGSTAPTITAGSSCTATVDFTPAATDSFSADLRIQSSDTRTPTFNMSLLGSMQDINSIDAKINQIDACPRPGLATIYVSVTDQGGFPVVGLDASAFSITEASTPKTIASAMHIDDTVTLSVALLMDYSGSVTGEPDNVTDMGNAAINFVNDLRANDEAEIIKYGTSIEVSQTFTSNVSDLITAIQATPNVGVHTALYDAVMKAVDDLSLRTKNRKAIIVITDGRDDDGSGNPMSVNSLNDVIANASTNGVPVFTIGLGSADAAILQQLADETGGTYSDSTTSDNLATIYRQLSDILFTDQYVLTYDSDLASTASGDLTVMVTYDTLTPKSDTKMIQACP